MKIEEIFAKSTNDNKSLTFSEFQTIVNAEKTRPKFTDLSEGRYVDRQKYLDDLQQKDTMISSLDDSLKSRDNDLSIMQTTLEETRAELEKAGSNSAKLSELQSSMAEMEEKYKQENSNLQNKLIAQSYEFAVRDYANGQRFSSGAAKRDFIQSMIAKNLPMENGSIIGADDYIKIYRKDNADAFYQEHSNQNDKQKPKFAGQTPGANRSGGTKSLSELMQLKNENPTAIITFE